MRIAVVSHTYTVPENREKWVRLQANFHHEVCLFIPEQFHDPIMPAPYPGKKADGPDVRVESFSTIFRDRIFSYFFKNPLKLKSALKAFAPHLIYVEQEPWSLSFFQISLIKRIFLPGTPIVFFTWENCRKSFAGPRALIRRFNMRTASQAVAGNREAVEVLRKAGYRGGVRVIPQLGVDPATFAPAEKGRRDAAHHIGFLGRLEHTKGVDLLIKAFAGTGHQDRFMLHIYGRGKEERKLKALAETLGLSGRVRFNRSIPHDEVPEAIRSFGVLVLPSRGTAHWKEQFGHVLIEAMSSGVPVIGARSGAIPEVIGDAGLLFREGDETDLSEKMMCLMDNPDLRNELGQRGRIRVNHLFTNDVISEKISSLFEEAYSKAA